MPEIHILNLFLLLAWITGLVVATCITAFNKWGWLDWYETFRRPWMPERCNFCLGFWLSFPVLAIFIPLLGIGEFREFIYIMLVPFASASIAKWVNK